MAARRDLKLVSFDGGGARSFSQLQIMGTIMHRLKHDRYPNEPHKTMLPCEHFDLIGGSGTGGLIAIMFARLRMSVEEVSAEFLAIVKETYEPRHLSPPERTQTLRQCMENVMTKRGFPVDLELREEAQAESCASFVTASLLASATSKLRLRTYSVRSQLPSNITVIDAVLTTCAAQPEFAAVSSGSDHNKREYIAVGFGANNPVRDVITEALELFGSDSSVGFLLSLGTGNPGAFSVPLGGRTDLHGLANTMMNDCEQRAQEIERQIRGVGVYFRFSVEQGLQNHHSAQASDPHWISTQASVYVSDQGISTKIDALLQNFNPVTRHITLDQLEYVGGATVSVQSTVTLEMLLVTIESIRDDPLLAKLQPPDLDFGPQVAECMEGTRQDILAKIKDWETDFDAPNILWLKGHPGVGKSAIATSLVEQLGASKRLGSSFFYQRQRAAIMSPSAMWRTVAYNLAQRYPTMGKGVISALKKDQALTTTINVEKIFEQLIRDPFMTSEEIPVERLPVVVIDALDECGGLDGQYSTHRGTLMRTLGSWSGLPRTFKLIVTSRGESDIETLFSTIPHSSIEISAGRTVDEQSSKDIRTFITYQLQQIALRYPRSLSSDWPGLDAVEKMTSRASGLFIWAEAVIRFIKAGQPKRRLSLVLEGVGTGDMFVLYEQILNTSFRDLDDDEIGDFGSVIGTIILAKAPLSFSSLAHLLSIDDITLEQICNGLQSVLESRGVLQFHHQSFVDFLIDPGRSTSRFFIKLEQETRTLTLACLRVLKDELRFNICDLKSSYLRNADILDLESRVKDSIPPHLSYSSCFWASHLAETMFDIDVFELLQYFMGNQFLFWLETLSLLRRVNLGSSMLLVLSDWLRAGDQDDAMAKDMRKFVATFANVVSQSVPHIYLSALPFSPRNSMISRQYREQFPRTIAIQTGGLSSWPAIQNVMSEHSGSVASVAFSPDGKRIVSGSCDRTIRVWDAETGEVTAGPFNGHVDGVESVAFSPDGKRLVSGSADETVRVWDAETGEMILGPLEGHSSWVISVAFSPDGKQIVSGSCDETIRVWDTESSEMVVGPLRGHSNCVFSVTFSPDGKRIVSGSHDKTIRLWDAETGQVVLGPLGGHTDRVTSVKFSPDGKHIISGSYDGTIRVWDVRTGNTVVGPLEGHSTVLSVVFSPDGKRISSGSHDGTIRVWDAETGEMVRRPLEGHSNWVLSVSFSPDATRLVSGYPDKTIRVWDAGADEVPVGPFDGHRDRVTSVAFSPDGKHVVSGSNDNTIRVWDAKTGQMVVGPLEGHSSRVLSVVFSPDGTKIVSGSGDMTIRVWDAETGEVTAGPFNGHMDGVESVAFSPDGKQLVSGSADKTVRVWDAETGEMILGPLEGHSGWVVSVVFSPDGKRIVSGSYDKTIRVWDTESSEMVVGPLRGHSNWVFSVAFSPDGKRIASGSYDKTIRVWNADTGDMVLGPLEGHSNWVYSVAFSPGGKRIVSGSYDKSILVWDAETGNTVIGPLEGHSNCIRSVKFSLDGKRIVSGSYDKTIRVWDAETGKTVIGPLEGHANWVVSVIFSPDGTRLVSGSSDRTLRVWDAETGDVDVAVGSFDWHSGVVTSVAFSPDGRHIASASEDKTIRVWDAETGLMVIGPLEGHIDWVMSVVFSPDGKRIASGSYDTEIRVWDAESGEMVVGPLAGSKGWVLSVAFSPDGKRIVSGSYDKSILVWDAETGYPVIGPLKGHSSHVRSVKFSLDGKRIVSSSSDKTIRVWDAETGNTVIRPLKGHNDLVLSVAFSPDGTRLVSGSSDRTVQVWDAETGDVPVGLFDGHSDAITSVAFSPDGKHIVSASEDKTIRVLDAKTVQMISPPFRGHNDVVTSVAFSPDGNLIASGSGDKTIRVWDVTKYNSETPNQTLQSFNDSSRMQDGWVLGSKSELLFWVPPMLRAGLLLPSTRLIIWKHINTKLDLKLFVHGQSWTLCKR